MVKQMDFYRVPTGNEVLDQHFFHLQKASRAKRFFLQSWKGITKYRKQLVIFTTLAIIADFLISFSYILEQELHNRNIGIKVTLIVASIGLFMSIAQKLVSNESRRRIHKDVVAMIDLIFIVIVILAVTIDTYFPYYLHAIVFPKRLKSLLRLKKTVYLGDTPFRENIIVLVATIVTIAFVFMCTFHIVEEKQNLSLLDSFYFIMVTLSTTGYGDITPKSPLGKMVIVCMIIIVVLIIPNLISSAVESYHLQRIGGGSFTKGNNPFVVIIGIFENLTKTFDILNSFFHSEYIDNPIDLVFFSPQPLSVAVKSLLTESIYAHRVIALLGDATDDYDMHRAKINEASAVFVLSNPTSTKLIEDDQNNTLRAWTIKNYAPEIPIYIYNHYAESENFQKQTAKAVVCINDIRQSILALNTQFPASATLILNLLYQSIPPHLKSSEDWLEEYSDGVGNEIYNSSFPSWFIDKSFIRVSIALQEKFNVILIGIARDDKVILSPKASLTIEGSDVGLFICQNNKQIDLINKRVLKIEPIEEELFEEILEESQESSSVPDLPFFDYYIPNCKIAQERKNLIIRDVREVPGLEGHVIICSYTPRLFKYVCMLRTNKLRNWDKLVIVTKEAPTDQDIEILSQFHDVWIIVGDPRQKRILLKAGLFTSIKVAILKLDQTDDAPSILIYHMTEHLLNENPSINLQNKPQIFVEINKRDHIRFFSKWTNVLDAPTKKESKERRKSFNFFRSEDRKHDPYFQYPLYAEGRIIVTSMLDTILFQTFHNEHVLEVVRHMSNLKNGSSFLKKVDVPQGMYNKCFKEVFVKLIIEQNLTTIGLYRWSVQNQHYYISVNPAPDLKILQSDSLFVL